MQKMITYVVGQGVRFIPSTIILKNTKNVIFIVDGINLTPSTLTVPRSVVVITFMNVLALILDSKEFLSLKNILTK